MLHGHSLVQRVQQDELVHYAPSLARLHVCRLSNLVWNHPVPEECPLDDQTDHQDAYSHVTGQLILVWFLKVRGFKGQPNQYESRFE